jgi:N-acetylated-alpha-linked acidic dipeptidase
MADTLRAKAVAYVNQDMPAWGRNFGGGGTASLHGLLWDVTRIVPFPGDTASIFSHWIAQTRTPPGQAPRLGDLGGGSDFGGFYNGLGIPSLDYGFGGTWGEYHSAYDTYTWMERFGDPGYLSHVAAAQVGAVLLGRLANADVVPFDYEALGNYLGRLVVRAVPDSAEQRALAPELADLASAADELSARGRDFLTARDRRLAMDRPLGDSLRLVNGLLREVERALTRPEGLVGRPLMHNLIFASDRDNGYADIALPGLAEAVRDHDLERARREARDLARRIRTAADAVRRAALPFGDHAP